MAESFQIRATVQELMASARESSGVDIVDSAIEEPLHRYLQSLNSEAQLSKTGAEAMEKNLLRLLENRLRMQRDINRHPEINEQKIIRPLFLTGAGRTGSTKLHKMLVASGDFIHLPFWQGYSLSSRSGVRGEDTASRIADAEAFACWFDAQTPVAKLIHSYEAFEPEEETLLLEHVLCGMFLMAFVFVPGYVGWSVQHFREQMEFVKQCLKYLQWQFHDGDTRPWVLKCPIHFGNEALLAEVFPDAVFVATHRNPLNTLSSQASLLEHYHKAYSDADRNQIYGQMMLEGQGMATDGFLASRDRHAELPSLDIGYPELKKDAGKVIEKIYSHAGMTLSATSRQAMREWESANAQHKLGEHKHSLEHFSLTPKMVNERFKAYMERFGALL